jgi:hypothetical protein
MKRRFPSMTLAYLGARFQTFWVMVRKATDWVASVFIGFGGARTLSHPECIPSTSFNQNL